MKETTFRAYLSSESSACYCWSIRIFTDNWYYYGWALLISSLGRFLSPILSKLSTLPFWPIEYVKRIHEWHLLNPIYQNICSEDDEISIYILIDFNTISKKISIPFQWKFRSHVNEKINENFKCHFNENFMCDLNENFKANSMKISKPFQWKFQRHFNENSNPISMKIQSISVLSWISDYTIIWIFCINISSQSWI